MSTCWPARCPGHRGTSRTRLAAAGVSRTMSVTSATSHFICSSIIPVPLLAERVAVVVVAERFPETGLVLVHESKAPHPLRALPEVEVRHEEAGGPAVLRIERFAVVAERDPSLAAGE